MKRNLWPYAIITYFIVFITGIVTWVSFAMRHDDQLVRADYYEHEIKYQDQIDRVARTDRSTAAITYDRASQFLHIRLPETNIQGTIHLYRPSNARLDQKFPLTTRIDVSSLEAGLWKIRLNWTHSNRDYYLEKPVVLYPTLETRN